MALKHLIAQIENKNISKQDMEKAIALITKIARSPKLRKRCHYSSVLVSICIAFEWRNAPGGSDFWHYIESAPNKL